MAERKRDVAAANRLSNLSESFSAKLETFTNMWCERINAEAPWFVARNVSEVELIYASIGFDLGRNCSCKARLYVASLPLAEHR